MIDASSDLQVVTRTENTCSHKRWFGEAVPQTVAKSWPWGNQEADKKIQKFPVKQFRWFSFNFQLKLVISARVSLLKKSLKRVRYKEWGSLYCKLGQVLQSEASLLQSGAIITQQDIKYPRNYEKSPTSTTFYQYAKLNKLHFSLQLESNPQPFSS